MKHLLARITWVLAGTCGPAFAAVTPLPGVSPQTTVAGNPFAEPILVRLTDAAGRPAAGAWVHWRQSDISSLRFEGASNCTRAVTALYCRVQANADGVASLGRAHATWGDDYRVSLSASRTSESPPQPGELGAAELNLKALPTGPVAVLQQVSGSGQRAVLSSSFAEPLVVRLLSAEGRPLAGETVSFHLDPMRGPRVEMAEYNVVTDAEGYARSRPIRAMEGVGRLEGTARYVDVRSSSTVQVPFTLFNLASDGRETLSFQDMWWSGPQESGWGMAIAQRGDRLFNAIFAYDDMGAPTWWVMPGGTWARGLGTLFGGPLYETRGAPYFAYDAAQFGATVKAPYASLWFGGKEDGGVLQIQDYWDPGRPAIDFSKSIVRTDFTMDLEMAVAGVGGLWWGGPAQNGWGVTIMEQPGHLFVVWLTYGEDGKPTWFVMPSGRWEGAEWTGTLYRTMGAAWYGKSYDASRLSVVPVGSLRIAFDGAQDATFRWEAEGRSGVVSITKQEF